MINQSVYFSNQILGFIPDIRNHPAAHYLRAGVPIVLGADDPGSNCSLDARHCKQIDGIFVRLKKTHCLQI